MLVCLDGPVNHAMWLLACCVGAIPQACCVGGKGGYWVAVWLQSPRLAVLVARGAVLGVVFRAQFAWYPVQLHAGSCFAVLMVIGLLASCCQA